MSHVLVAHSNFSIGLTFQHSAEFCYSHPGFGDFTPTNLSCNASPFKNILTPFPSPFTFFLVMYIRSLLHLLLRLDLKIFGSHFLTVFVVLFTHTAILTHSHLHSC
ncbi:hypothetical protein AAZV13_06G027100 [Glycine max]